jgi:2'-5' RNA ligase
VRCFVAVDLPADVRRWLAEVQRELASRVPAGAVRWVRPEGTHLTLKFLGEVAPGRLGEIQAALGAALAPLASLRAEVGGVGCFPSLHRPRVVWAGVHDAGDGLGHMQRAIDEHLEPAGFAREGRPFSPHLTLGRVQEGQPPAVLEAVGEAVTGLEHGEPCTMPVERVTLFRSDLRPGGAVYSVLWEARLAHDG